MTEVERLDREGRIVELAAMLGGGPGDAAALASARELLDRAEAWRAGPVGAAVATAHVNLDRAIDDYLSYLRVERGLADATIRAYRGDLRDFSRTSQPGTRPGTAPPMPRWVSGGTDATRPGR